MPGSEAKAGKGKITSRGLRYLRIIRGQLKLVEGALKRGWSLKRDPFDVEKDDPYADVEYNRIAALFDNGELTEKICKMLIDAGWDCSQKDKDNYTPADDAYAVGHIKLALYIRSKQERGE
eukprot:g1940.t1